jgi:uncharacterized membrane protein
MQNDQPGLDELNRILRDLLLRVTRLEQRLELLSPPHPTSSAGNQAAEPVVQSNPNRSFESTSEILAPAPDLESRIGAHWLNRIGIIAVLVGVSFFLKYAFEAEWIGPSLRVVIGLLAGIALIAWSEWFRVHEYSFFSFSLKALGLGILYLSLWAAFQVYELISWAAAFSGMVAVTASTAVFALWQDAPILALFALIGGFATPVLLHTRENRALQLFAYLALLNAATLFLAASRAWRRLLLFSVLATFVLFCLWYFALYAPRERSTALSFVTLFFGIFAVAPLVESHSRPQIDGGAIFALLPAALNAGAYLVEIYLLLGRTDNSAAAWCALALAGIYFALAQILRRTNQRDVEALHHLHLALGVVSITLAITIRFESYWISIGWFAEAAVLMTIGFWRRSAFVRWQALGLIALTIAKVFVLDLWGLERGYRIVSFVLLGILLLAVSFLYQRDWLKLSLKGGE